jgi:hypothetical protein
MEPAFINAILRWSNEHGDRGFFTTDTELKIQSWNGWLEATTGVAATDAIGRPLFDVLPSLTDRGLDHHYSEALAGQIKILSHSLHRYIIPTVGLERPANRCRSVPRSVRSRTAIG